MVYRNDPKTNAPISALGFGCMRFARAINGRIDLEKAERLVMAAIERGVNYFDTAYIYGGSEQALGEILSKNDARDKILLATKLPYQQCKTYGDYDRIFNEQLARLKTDHIDYYLIHNLSTTALWQEQVSLGITKWLAEKLASGQIRRVGFSFHGAHDQFVALLDAHDWDFVQIQYNYMNETYQAGRDGLERAAAKGLPVIVMEPLLGGKLANPPEAAKRLFAEHDANRTPAAMAMRWLWNQPGVTCVLSGMNDMPQLTDNLSAAEGAAPGMLTERDLAVYAAVAGVFKQSYKIPCTGCNYCMPCPKGVNIPAAFAAYNARAANGLVTGLMQYITSTGINRATNSSPRNCVKCGKCEQHCPQNIKIIAELETVAKRMEPWYVRAAMKVASRFM